MQQYKDLLQKVLDEGVRKPNRTGIDTLGIIGAHMQFDMADGFPAVTVKKLAWKTAIAEMLGFLRGYTNAAEFRALGCNVWDQNANENQEWLNNPHRQGEDDLGRIYGAQARSWRHTGPHGRFDLIDQLRPIYNDLKAGCDNRREIVSHWNPGEMQHAFGHSYMALPPCHLLYQFGIQDGRLHLSMYQRSCDMALGVPFNIAGYSWLLMVMAEITGLEPSVFNHFLHDVHIYDSQIDGVKTMLEREPKPLPTLTNNTDILTLDDLQTWVTVNDFDLLNYAHHDPIKMNMAV